MSLAWPVFNLKAIEFGAFLAIFTLSTLRWFRHNAQRSVQSCKNGEGLPIQVYGDRDLFMMQKLSPNQPVYIDMARERSGILNIKARFF